MEDNVFGPAIVTLYLFLSSCINNSLVFIPTYYVASFNFIKKSYQNNTLGDQLAGPIGIVKNADQMMLDQIRGVLFLFIIISLFVGLFNLLPIPLLDGGHIMYFIIKYCLILHCILFPIIFDYTTSSR